MHQAVRQDNAESRDKVSPVVDRLEAAPARALYAASPADYTTLYSSHVAPFAQAGAMERSVGAENARH
jgi:hypothetical protein